MKWVLTALLLSPSLVLALDCNKLSETAEKLEIELMRSYDKTKCEGDRNESNCASAAEVLAKLRQLKNQRALLEGIEKLKTDIRSRKEEVSRLSGNGAQLAALDFSKGLVIAQTFESVVNAPDALAKLKAARLNLTANGNYDLRLAFRGVEGFNPTPEALNELKVVLSGPMDLNEDLLNRWKEALRIKKLNVPEADSAYSFSKMREDVAQTGDVPASFNRQQLDLIKNVSDFGSAPELSFLTQAKAGKINAVVRDQFKLLTEDLIKRQKEELRTTISYAVAAHREGLAPASDSADCTGSKTDSESAVRCAASLKALMSGLSGGSTAQRAAYQDLSGVISAADVTKRYIEQVGAKTQDCLAAINTSLGTATDINVSACEGIVTKNMDELNADIQALEQKKNEIFASETPTAENRLSPAMVSQLREFALDKIRQQCSPTIDTSVVEDCNPTTFDKELSLLTTSTMKVAIGILQGETGDSVEVKDISSICSSDPTEATASYLCELTTVVREDSGTTSDDREEIKEDRRQDRRRKKEERPFWNGVAQALPALGYQLGQNRALAQQQAYQNALWLNSLRASMYPTNPIGFYPTYYPQNGFVNGLTYLPTSGVPTYSSFGASPLSNPSGTSNYFYLQY